MSFTMKKKRDSKVVSHEYEINGMPEDQRLKLIDYAKKHILEDEGTLINYAFIRILKEQIQKQEEKNALLNSIVKKRKSQKTTK